MHELISKALMMTEHYLVVICCGMKSMPVLSYCLSPFLSLCLCLPNMPPTCVYILPFHPFLLQQS